MQMVAARIIGRKIDAMLKNSKSLHHRILTILNKRTQMALWEAMAEGMTDRL